MNESGITTYDASVAITAQHLRVKLASATTIALAGLTDKEIGYAQRVVAQGDPVAVKLTSHPGTLKAVASKAIAVNDPVYSAASGKVSDVQGTGAFLIGVALTAAGADGEVFELLPNTHGETAGS